MPTVNRWRGDAQGVAQVDTITPANAEIGDKFTVICNRKEVSYTVTTDDTLDDVTGYVSAAVNGLVAALTAAAELYGEYSEMTYEAGYNEATDPDHEHPTHVVVTGLSDGTPFTLTTSTTNASSYTIVVTEVQAGSAAVNEIQRISLPSTTSGGTFTLTFAGQTTAATAYNASAATVKTNLEALSNIAPGDVTVTKSGSVWSVEFTGVYAGINVPLMTGSGASLTGSGGVSVSTTTQGGPGTNEVGSLTFSFDGTSTYNFGMTFVNPSGVSSTSGDIMIGANTPTASIVAILQAELDAMTSVGSGNTSVAWYSGSSVGAGNERVFRITFIGALAQTDVAVITISDPGGIGYVPTYDVVTTGSSTDINEVQVITITGSPTGGTFTITFQGQTTAGVAYNASSATLQTALEALSNIAPGDITVTGSAGGPYTVTFLATYAATDVQQMTGSGASLTGGAVTVITTQEAAAGVNEKQQVEIVGTPTGGTFTLTFNAETTAGIAYNAAASAVQTALEGLATPVPGDVSVSGDAAGPWLVTFTGAYAATNVAIMTGSGASLTGAGTQTLTQATSTTGTGPHHANNADNWTLGTVIANGERAYFADTDSSMLYGLDQSTITPDSVDIDSSFTGTIGLPDYNANGYFEYRTTLAWTIGTASATLMTINVGQGDGSGSERIRLNTGARKTKLVVRKTGSSSGSNEKALRWKGTHANNIVHLYRGSVGIADQAGEAATVDVLMIGYVNNQESDVDLEIGDGVTLNTVTKEGGFAEIWCAIVTSFEQIAGQSGETVFRGVGAMAQLYVRGGLFVYASSGTLGGNTVVSGDGELNFDQSLTAITCTNSIKRYGPNASIVDNNCIVNGSGDLIIDCYEEPIADDVNLGAHQRWVRRDIP